jgi:hypothetical protein
MRHLHLRSLIAAFGGHNDEVPRQVLSASEHAIADLRIQGVS